MKTNIRKSGGFTLVELLVVIAIIVTLAGVATPVLLAQRKRADHAEAIQNAKQVGYALFNFEGDYGRYPDENTKTDIADEDTDLAPDAGTANEYLSQLVVTGYVDQEAPFYCRTDFTIDPDNDKSSGKLLEAGECGFTYIMRDASNGLNSSINSACALLAAPSAFNPADGYNSDVYNSRSVVLRIDMSVSDPRIDDQGIIRLRNGDDLYDNGADTPWGTSIEPVEIPPATGSAPAT